MDREPLPDIEEVPLLAALGWLTFGRAESILKLNSETREDQAKRLESAWRQLARENPSLASGYWPSELAPQLQEMLRQRHALGPRGKIYLRELLRMVRIEKCVYKAIGKQEERLLEAARTGIVRMRGKSNPLDTEASPIDPSYFDNPVAVDLLDDGLDFDHSAPMEDWLHRPHPDPLKRYGVRVGVAGLRHLAAAERAPNAAPQSVTRRRVPNAADSRALEKWSRSVLAETGKPPRLDDALDWGDAHGLSQASLKELRRSLPSKLRREVGERD